VEVDTDKPVLVDKYLDRATELDVDALCDKNGNVVIAGVMEHIEQAGIHSGEKLLWMKQKNGEDIDKVGACKILSICCGRFCVKTGYLDTCVTHHANVNVKFVWLLFLVFSSIVFLGA
jgi:hypothetical protein